MLGDLSLGALISWSVNLNVRPCEPAHDALSDTRVALERFCSRVCGLDQD